MGLHNAVNRIKRAEWDAARKRAQQKKESEYWNPILARVVAQFAVDPWNRVKRTVP